MLELRQNTIQYILCNEIIVTVQVHLYLDTPIVTNTPAQFRQVFSNIFLFSQTSQVRNCRIYQGIHIDSDQTLVIAKYKLYEILGIAQIHQKILKYIGRGVNIASDDNVNVLYRRNFQQFGIQYSHPTR